MTTKQMHKLQVSLLILFSLAMAITIAFAVTGTRNALHERENNRLAQESQDRLLLLENLTRTLFEAESSQRAYAASGHNLYQEEHELQRSDAAMLMRALEFTTFPTPAQRERVGHLQELIAQRLAAMDALAATRREQGAEAAAQAIASQDGKRIMDKLRKEVDLLVADEHSGLKTRTLISETHNRRFIQFVIGGTAFTLLLLSGAFLAIRREMTRNDKLVERLRISGEEISRINQLSSSLQSCESRSDAGEVLRHYMARLLPGTSGGLYLMRPSRNLLELSAAWGDKGERLSDPIKPQDCWALRSGRPQETSAGGDDMRCAHLGANDHTCLCVPLMAQSDIVGMLHLTLEDSTRLPAIRQLSIQLSTHLSAAMAGIILREALHQQSIRDPLTDLYNRRYLEESLERELLRARRSQGSVAVIMLDIDHFKQFNDTHGHRAGDVLLKDFAQYLRSHVRGEDILCRYGGEEFLLVLPATNLQQGRERAEALRANMVSVRSEYQGQPLPAVTASLGIAVYPDHAEDWGTLIHLADAALYHAKRSGRNKVSAAGDADVSILEEQS